MNNEEKFIVLDENGNEKEATIINIIEIDEKEYLLYTTEENEEEDKLYVGKIVKDADGEEDIITIEDEEERTKVFETAGKNF